jgi:hypothetical protein
MTLFVPMSVLVFPANKHFGHFDDTHKLAEIGVMHRSAKPHAHIPCGFVRAASDLPLNLQCANGLFGCQRRLNSDPPLGQIAEVKLTHLSGF